MNRDNLTSAVRNILVLAAAVIALGCGADPEPRSAARPLTGKPPDSPALTRLETEAARLLDGTPDDFRRRLAQLKGHPVVVNQWASWCSPCRYEFPFFQALAAKYRGRVAFLGVDAQDSRGAAEAFLKEFPTPFPHFYDEDASIARVFRGGTAWPTTAYYAASGKLVKTHLGAYATKAKLESDLKEFALGG